MHRLSTSFILGYHGCERETGDRLLAGEPFKPSNNDYDWLGSGVYFWEANPQQGLQFAREAARRKGCGREPTVIGAVSDLAHCLDLTTTAGIEIVKARYAAFVEEAAASGDPLPANSSDRLRRQLDCAVINSLHTLLGEAGMAPIDTVKAVFFEGQPIYPGAGFYEKTHTQIAVCNLACIRGIFRVPADQLR